MRVTVRQCPFTGKIFEEKDIGKYVLHLKAQHDRLKQERQYARLRNSFDQWLAEEKEKITSVDMIVPWILENQQRLMDTANALDIGCRDPFVKGDQFTKLVFERLYYHPLVSNTHCYPKNGVINFSSKDNLPRGYPGYFGYMSGTLSRPNGPEFSYPYSKVFKLIRLHTGSGGGGNKNWGYDIKIFLDDWPGLSQEVVAAKLAGTWKD